MIVSTRLKYLLFYHRNHLSGVKLEPIRNLKQSRRVARERPKSIDDGYSSDLEDLDSEETSTPDFKVTKSHLSYLSVDFKTYEQMVQEQVIQ